MNDLKSLVYKHALINAVKHKGKANEGAVIGSIMASNPEMRKNAGEIVKIAKTVVAQVNDMEPQHQKSELEKTGGKIADKKVEEKGLVDLPNVKGEVVLRFAPNPSGPLHIGHARAAILNNEYVKRYGGKLILRIEDTDPRRVDMDAYEMIPEDLHWLNVEWQDIVVQSDRIPIYYEYAELLIKKGAAYMCDCSGADFKRLKDSSQPCPCREMTVEDNLQRWFEMENMNEGDAVLRVKTDLNHKNPAIRDWVAMRIVEEEHPRIGSKYKIYPMMNFSVAVDDHLMGITHVLRGKDHLANSEKQKYLYGHFEWDVPEFIHYGRLKMEDIALSTSKARTGIEEGIYTGWDDPRLGTIRAIARRGIRPEAIHRLMIEIGVKIADSILSWKKIYGLNRNLLEKEANRYFFVEKPVKLSIKNLPESTKGIIKRALHPDFLDRGYRKIPFDGEVYIQMDDFKEGKILRLMDAVNIIIKDNEAVFHSVSFEDARKVNAQIIQWIPSNENLDATIVMPDASLIEGLAEPQCINLNEGDEAQFERFGFVRLDQKNSYKLNFYFTHK
ncbi:MAG: glutamate--tRNA ligase [Methanobacterium sp. BRmetb2]|nr:MAG: glutamate--tRNA ligase [Methanobacterium sp. BRmetb2]